MNKYLIILLLSTSCRTKDTGSADPADTPVSVTLAQSQGKKLCAWTQASGRTSIGMCILGGLAYHCVSVKGDVACGPSAAQDPMQDPAEIHMDLHKLLPPEAEKNSCP